MNVRPGASGLIQRPGLRGLMITPSPILIEGAITRIARSAALEPTSTQVTRASTRRFCAGTHAVEEPFQVGNIGVNQPHNS